MIRADDQRWMAQALGLAARRLGQTWPNPSVGCVIVGNGRVLGRGVTGEGGRPHAETEALRMVRDRFGAEAARGATAYVSLEPCAHHGKTPPCSEALIAAGISRVVCPHADPDPRVAGRGIARLDAAGVVVDVGTAKAEARTLNAGFLSRIERGRPHLTLKLAASVDGRIATASGESRWITGPEARRAVHMMRAQSDAIMVGIGTVLADDPMLDVRDVGLADRSPVRVVLDTHLRLPRASRLAKTVTRVPVWVLHDVDADPERAASLTDAGVRLLPVGTKPDGRLDAVAALDALGRAGITRLMSEGGATVAAALLGARLVDRLTVAVAGLALGADATPAIGTLGLDRLGDAARMDLTEMRRVGADLWSSWAPREPAAPAHGA